MFEIRPILSALARHKSSTLLIVLQIAITFAVVINSFSIIQQRISVMNRDSGLKEEQLFSLNVTAFGKSYDSEYNMQADLELLRNTPGVIDATSLNHIPMSGSGSASGVANSRENYDNRVRISTGVIRGGTHALNTLGVKLIAGRNFRESEVTFDHYQNSPTVTIITKSLADKLYPDGSALGKKLVGSSYEVTIIGIIEHMSGFWVSWSGFDNNLISPEFETQNILIRAEKNAIPELLGSVENLLFDRNQDRVISEIHTLFEYREKSYSDDRAMSIILWIVISLLVIVTSLGIVGIVSFNINQRIKQIGTRRALGARKIDIGRYFVTENLIITSLGLTLGFVFAIGFNIYLVGTFEISPINWYYLPFGMLFMLVIGILSVWIPAQKASNVSPAVATQSI